MSTNFINNPEFQADNEEMKSVYNKWLQRQFGKRMPVHVFGSGSDGNSVYLKPYHALIDLGLPYKKYMAYDPQFFIGVDVIILTHHHDDHLNPSTLIRVLDNHPHIKVIISDDMWRIITADDFKPQYIKREAGEIAPFGHDPKFKTDESGRRLMQPPRYKDDILAHQSKFISAAPQTFTSHDGRTFLFEPLTVKHGDIVNIAVQISDPSGEFKLLYASDLDNLDGPRTFIDQYGNKQEVTGLNQSREYTVMFLEANYDEAILKEWYDNLDPADPDYRQHKARADGNLRHISEQEAARYIQKFLADDGLFIPLHASRTFGTLYQN